MSELMGQPETPADTQAAPPPENKTMKQTAAQPGSRAYVQEAFQMAWPSVLESFFVAFAGLVDSLMVSRLGAYAVAAVGLTTQPKFISLALFLATNVAVSAIVARRRGQNDRYGANQTLLLALALVAIAGALISGAAVWLADPIIRLCGSSADTHEAAVEYFRIIVGGMMFNIISLVINAAQRGAGRTRIAMKTNVTANLLNIIFNYLLIGGNFGFPALGIRGAALATVLGTVVACGMSIASILRRDSFVSVPYMLEKRVKPVFDTFRSIVRIGSNIFVEQLLMRIGFMSTALMVAKLGTDAFAAHQVGMNVMSLSFSFGDGMQAAAVALIGRSLGQKDPELAKTYGKICQRMGNFISVVLAVIYIVGGEWLYRLFFTEEHIIAMGVVIMRLIVVIVILQIAQVIYMGCLRGAGDVLFTTLASTFSVTIVRTSASYLLCYPLGLGLAGIWIGIIADQFSRFVLTNWRFRSGVWTKVEV
ncbi:MAG: MATE family efflux transporter [Eubacteriales bacterium]|nr:MATE family efflux transporter [Eubacteriales bacterium]